MSGGINWEFDCIILPLLWQKMNVLIDTDCGTDDTFCIGNFLRLHKAGHCKVVGTTRYDVITDVTFSSDILFLCVYPLFHFG